MAEEIEQNLNTYSHPSQLNITDMRIAHLRGPLVGATIIRIDTNQGISGPCGGQQDLRADAQDPDPWGKSLQRGQNLP